MKSKNKSRDGIEKEMCRIYEQPNQRALAAAMFKKIFGVHPNMASSSFEQEATDNWLLDIETAVECDKMTKEEFYKFYLGGLSD